MQLGLTGQSPVRVVSWIDSRTGSTPESKFSNVTSGKLVNLMIGYGYTSKINVHNDNVVLAPEIIVKNEVIHSILLIVPETVNSICFPSFIMLETNFL